MFRIGILPASRLLAIALAVAGSSSFAPAGETPAGPPVTPANDSFTEHVARLKPKVPDGFTVVIQPPFVVIGDEPPATVQMRATLRTSLISGCSATGPATRTTSSVCSTTRPRRHSAIIRRSTGRWS
jgi:hypothetical protein